mgnify:CR=1 FL=1
MKFSANLGFLWADRPLPEAIRAAKSAGFDAVECHWPYDTPAQEVRAALREMVAPLLHTAGLHREGHVAGTVGTVRRDVGLRACRGGVEEQQHAFPAAEEYVFVRHV